MNRIEKIHELLQTSPQDNFLQHALALELIKAGDDAEARSLFLSILERDPDYTGTYYHLAKLLERSGETELAIQWYEAGMKACKQAGDQHAYNELQAAYEDWNRQLIAPLWRSERRAGGGARKGKRKKKA